MKEIKPKEKTPGLTALQRIEKLGKAVANMTQAELARAVGVSRERIRQLVPRLKIKPGRRIIAWHRTLSNSQLEAIAKMYEEGTPLPAIAKKYKVSEYHVREALKLVRRKKRAQRK
ncbi:MAG: sigma factor-like helix-turn-helix DNA-binding protein [candidate division WOR-3 bacterium]